MTQETLVPEKFGPFPGVPVLSTGSVIAQRFAAVLAADDAHYRARAVHVEWEDEQVGTRRGTRPVPVFSKPLSKICRGTAAPGADNERGYGQLLGKTLEQSDKLRAEGAI